MAVTLLGDVQEQMQKFWSPKFTKQLRAKHLLAELVNKDYQGEIKNGGDTVYVSQINAPTGQNLTIDTAGGASTFTSEKVSTSRVAVVADKRAVASYDFEDLVSIQSLIDKDEPEVLWSLMFAMKNQMNDYLYSLVNPSTSAPDHLRNSITDFNKSELLANRLLAAQAKWTKEKGWWALLDPSYYNDVLSDTTMTSGDYVDDKAVVGGQVASKRFGFNILEDDSRSVDTGLLFCPDFMIMVQQPQVQIKISDLHPLGQFGYKMSVDLIYGAKLGINGNVKHIKVLAA